MITGASSMDGGIIVVAASDGQMCAEPDLISAAAMTADAA